MQTMLFTDNDAPEIHSADTYFLKRSMHTKVHLSVIKKTRFIDFMSAN